MNTDNFVHGQQIRLKPADQIMEFSTLSYNDAMRPLSGTFVIFVFKIDNPDHPNKCFGIQEDYGEWTWHTDWIDPDYTKPFTMLKSHEG